MVAVSSSSLFTPSSIAGIRFPLDAGSSPPLHFAPLETMSGLRKSSKSTSCQSPLDSLVTTDGALADTSRELFSDHGPFGQIALALLLLGYGYTDECHNLITPLSWPDDIHFAAGPSVYHQMAPDVRAFATYTHCLVHRREAFNTGEFGMVGFANANYWSSAVQRSDASSLPHVQWRDQVLALAGNPEFANVTPIQKWCQAHDFVASTTSYFESRAIHELCATVLRAEESGNKAVDHAQLKDFAERVAESEIRILLKAALERAGIRVAEETTTTTTPDRHVSMTIQQTVHPDMGIRAMKSISSAHLDNFLTDGSIVLRRVSAVDDDNDNNDISSSCLSVAAGIACRLFQVPACKIHATNKSENPWLAVLLPLTSEAAAMLAKRIGRPMDLSTGDGFVLRLAPGQGLDASLSGIDGVQCWQLESCTKDDPEAVFVDPLFGSRGETPTTVIQWSKGTIF